MLFTLSECSFNWEPLEETPPVEELPPGEETPPNEEDPEVIESLNGIDYIYYDNDLYHAFFDIESTIEISIDIEKSELAKIQSDYDHYKSKGSKSPIYRKANVTIKVNNQTFEFDEVGIRMKGNTSRTSFYNDSEGMYNMIHFKLSFNQTFDNIQRYESPKVWSTKALRDERKDRLFAGMEKIDLKWNRPKDETYSREYWTYEMFRAYGVLAPKVAPSNLKINYDGSSQNLGVVYAIETVDEMFLEKRLDKKHLDGDLYKVGWDNQYGGNLTLNTLNRIGIEDEELSYFPVYDLKTNKKTSKHEHMKNLIQKINSENKPEDLVNINYYAAFEAVSFLSGNPDDLRNHYNNYYIYFLKDTNLAIFIPYDYDRTFGINWDWNPTGNSMTSYSPYTLRTTMGGVNDQSNPLILKTFARGSNKTELVSYYRSLILEITESKFFDIDEFYEVYEIQKSKYNDLTHYSNNRLGNNETKFNKDESINMPFKTYVERKLDTVNQLIDSY